MAAAAQPASRSQKEPPPHQARMPCSCLACTRMLVQPRSHTRDGPPTWHLCHVAVNREQLGDAGGQRGGGLQHHRAITALQAEVSQLLPARRASGEGRSADVRFFAAKQYLQRPKLWVWKVAAGVQKCKLYMPTTMQVWGLAAGASTRGYAHALTGRLQGTRK